MDEIAAARSLFFSYPMKGVDDVLVFSSFSLSLYDGETTVVVGPSGCGKTTLVRLMGGLLRPSRGQVMFQGREISGPGRDRQIVFQSDSCFPWLTVYNNVRFACQDQDGRKIENALKLVGLEKFGKFLPSQLSLGMRQRVALARALVSGASMLLFDEALGSLDALIRRALQEQLRNIISSRLRAAMWVTHDLEEALVMGDRIIIIGGRPVNVLSDLRPPVDLLRVEGGRFSAAFQQEYRSLFETAVAVWKGQ